MNDLKKIVLILVVILYVVSPIDLIPGNFLDDIVVILLAYAYNRKQIAA